MKNKFKVTIAQNGVTVKQFSFLEEDIVKWNHYGNVTLRELIMKFKKKENDAITCQQCRVEMEPISDQYYLCPSCGGARDLFEANY